MAIPVPHTWTAGDSATSTNLQTLTDAILYLLGSTTSAGARRPLLRGRQTVAQSIANNTMTSVTFDAEDVDYDNSHSTVTNTSRFTAQTAGWHWVSGICGFTGNATGSRLLQLAVNGTGRVGTEAGYGTAPNAGHVEITVGDYVFLNAADYLELQASQVSTASLSLFVQAQVAPLFTVEWRSN